MKLGLQISNFTLPGGPLALAGNLKEMAVRAEEAGFYSVWVMDHFFQIPYLGPPELEMMEAYTTLGFLAACTKKMQLGTLVTGVTYRHPGVLAKIISTLDVLSQGRAWLGIGAGWFEEEHLGLGVPFPSVSERFEKLEETIQICQQMWSESNDGYKGKHFQLGETLCVPQPLRLPPIMIGGMGEKKTLRMVAEYGQACNLFEHAGLKTLEYKLRVLKEHCDRLGRDYNSISKTVLGQTSITNEAAAEKLIRKLQSLSELGFDQAIYSFKEPTNYKNFDMFAGKIIPAALELT